MENREGCSPGLRTTADGRRLGRERENETPVSVGRSFSAENGHGSVGRHAAWRIRSRVLLLADQFQATPCPGTILRRYAPFLGDPPFETVVWGPSSIVVTVPARTQTPWRVYSRSHTSSAPPVWGGNVKCNFLESRDSADLNHGPFGFFEASEQLNPRVGLKVSVLVHEATALSLSSRLALSRDSLELTYLLRELTRSLNPPTLEVDERSTRRIRPSIFRWSWAVPTIFPPPSARPSAGWVLGFSSAKNELIVLTQGSTTVEDGRADS